jgi:archaemetzincin
VKPIVLVPLGNTDRSIVHDLRDGLAQRLAAPVEEHEVDLDLERFFSPERVQYNSSDIIHALETAEGKPWGEDRRKVLAVAAEDLFIPILTFVFGEAQLGGDFAVVSYHRLRNAAYGLPPDPPRESNRLLKEALHELGHTLGLVHCSSLDCVMHTSTYVEDIDLKEAMFCLSCREFALKNYV